MSSLTSVLLVRNSGTLALNKYKFNLYTYISEGGNWHVLVPNLLGKPLIAFGQKLSMELNAAVFVLEWHDDYIWKTLLIQNGEELAGIKLDLERPKRSKIQAVEAMRDFVLDEAAFDQFLNLVNQDASQLSIVGLEQGIHRMLIAGDLTGVNYDSMWSLNDAEIEAMQLHYIENRKGLELKQLISKSFQSTLEEELGFDPIRGVEGSKNIYYYTKVEDEREFTLRIDASRGSRSGRIMCNMEGQYGHKLLGIIFYSNEKELRGQLSNYLSGSNLEKINTVLNFNLELFNPENTYLRMTDRALHELGFVRSHTGKDLLCPMTGAVEYKQIDGDDEILFVYKGMVLEVQAVYQNRRMFPSDILTAISSTPRELFKEFTNESEFQARMVEILEMIKTLYTLRPVLD
ncbi:hypothetical protein PaecuDRAFT_1822 [Paenibacillus curdlanolyticus YK9]|uniref:Uncharacterized protein n=1 Tax=Paenibacillus curdlanolyticus YK9 TaxID=717606 RepID=E0I871_9BACL|nr:hypothetical protein [Paenibacillus curdlanolyticus]EFM11376.1 hypothetical protein PaecuDRAFT_1822 [Paenibacillus curdlanolyticus YK9]